MNALAGSSGSSTGRFHAIVSATPRDAFGPPVISSHYFRPTDHAASSPDTAPTKKRKREGDGTAVRVRRHTDGRTLRSSDKYEDCQQLMNALRDRFQQGQDVEFHGNYELSDPGVSHRQRIQTLTNEIWRTTGYRFTVKDHPRLTNGHKTRFWCSQDEAHKNKLKGARAASGDVPKPRLTSAGDAMAKPRYPCRSRLLISSRDSEVDGKCIVTIRLAHHYSHEAYFDGNLPPEASKSICESFGWYPHNGGVELPLSQGASSSAESSVGMAGTVTTSPESNPLAVNPSILRQPAHVLQQYEMEDVMHEVDSPSEDEDEFEEAHAGLGISEEPAQMNHSSGPPQLTSTPTYVAPPPPPVPPPINIDIYRERMRSHVANLREFCDGLEFQLQFNDTRMLDVLEREGGSFLKLVEDCLRKENRLVAVPVIPPPVPPDPNGVVRNGNQHHHSYSPAHTHTRVADGFV